MLPTHASVVAVAIGRNEGARLVRCLASLREAGVDRLVYVDSGSTDGSVVAARAVGAEVVELDMSRPFTAARARNAGMSAASAMQPAPLYLQFIDGDCEVRAGWVAGALAFLEANPRAAVACGRRRERHPDTSIYNRLCDSEWDTPIGLAKACGGDALIRVAALAEVGGYDPRLIAGEEPEMCVRLRAKGWEIWRLDAEMALHDAAMTRFGQFWKRARRSGHAFAEGAALHGSPPEWHGVAGSVRALVWGLALPLAILALFLAFSPLWLLMVTLYPVQIARVAWRDGGNRPAWERATLLTLGKFAEALGVLEYLLRRLVRRPSGLIEYK